MAHIVTMQPWFSTLGYVLLYILIAHLAFTFIPMLINRYGGREKPYAWLNWRCYLQRIAGVVIIAFIHPHFNAFTQPPNVMMKNLFYLVAMIALVIFCCLHISVSIPKALVGLGIIVEKKPLDLVEKICFVCVFVVGAVAIWGACVVASFSGLFRGSL